MNIAAAYVKFCIRLCPMSNLLDLFTFLNEILDI